MQTDGREIGRDYRQQPAVVIFNGPSRQQWQDHAFPGYLLGCNYAYRDWPLTHCWAVDRMTVAHIRGELEGQPLPCEFWTKESSLELPPQWQHKRTPGIDSGTAAIDHALQLTDQEVLVIGCDGVLGLDHNTAYEFPWHPTGPTAKTHSRHRETLVELLKQFSHRLFLVSDRPSELVKTIDSQQAKNILNKYKAKEGL